MNRVRGLLWIAALGVAAVSCVQRLSVDGRPCPCEDGWTCLYATGRCFPGTPPDGGIGGDAPPLDAAAVGDDGGVGPDAPPAVLIDAGFVDAALPDATRPPLEAGAAGLP